MLYKAAISCFHDLRAVVWAAPPPCAAFISRQRYGSEVGHWLNCVDLRLLVGKYSLISNTTSRHKAWYRSWGSEVRENQDLVYWLKWDMLRRISYLC